MSTKRAKKKEREKIDFKAFVEIFNAHGKSAALKHVSERYSMQYNTLVKRLREESEYRFDQSRDRYYLKSEGNDTTEFLTIEELSRPTRQEEQGNINVHNDAILNLIVDRFFELNQFVSFLNREQKIVINLTSAKAAGYNIEYV